MATPNEKLAHSLETLRTLQRGGRSVFKSGEIGRTHRERLLRNGFLHEVIKGWLISTGPHTQEGDTTPWYASFWAFCALYCRDRFGSDWHLSPEQSLLLHAEATAIPPQVIVYSPKGSNNTVQLLFGTSVYDLKQTQMPPREDVVEKDGLHLFALDAALVKVPEAFFQRAPIEVQVALAAVRDVSGVLSRLLDGGHSVVAGRLAGAFRRAGKPSFADEIVKAMRGAGYGVRELDPFAENQHVPTIITGGAPIVGRINVIWDSLRQTVIDNFPEAPGRPADPRPYLKFVEDIYKSDAYHSLSIEGYNVTPDLVDRVRQGGWNPEIDEPDRKNRDALAARGYWQAFQKVRDSVTEIVQGTPPGALVREQHGDWYRELFQPSVAAGILRAGAMAGYRNQPVYLRGSRHVPPRSEAVPEGMAALFDLLEQEVEPSVRAVLGHWLVGYIHPYPDGNGRMARFLMNAMLASGGYPWTVVRVEDRDRYLTDLESASIDMDIRPFATFLAERMQWSMKKAG